MKRYFNSRNAFLFLILAFLISLNACKKQDNKPGDASAGGNGNGNSIDPKDLTAKDIDSLKFYIWYINVSDSANNLPLYLWEDQVPSSFKWYSSSFNTGEAGTTAQNEMDAIASFSPKVNGRLSDRYSFIDMTGAVSDELQGGKMSGDFGFVAGAALDPDNNVNIYIMFSYKDGPAGMAGVKRGDQIIAINGNTDMSLDTKSNVDRINHDLFDEQSVKLELKRPGESTTYSVNLEAGDYHLNPVMFDSVYTFNGEKVGYFVYNTFVSITAGKNGATAKKEIDDAFSKFKEKGVSDLIVDLRYNGGGAVESAEYLDNLIAPSSASGQEMFKYVYNSPLTSYFNSSDTLKKYYIDPTNFVSVGNNLNLSRVFFIVGSNTASASELTINNLKPYMQVHLVGDTTYGKPVGFFTVPIEYVTQNRGLKHVADMYAINFKSVNSAGESDYFGGMLPDQDALIPDYIDAPWGNKDNDHNLRSVFNFIENGNFLTEDYMKNHPVARRAAPDQTPFLRKAISNKLKKPNQFNGMVDYKMNFNILKKK